MKIELFLDEGEEYPQLFSVWRVDQNTGRADLTTRRNYVDDRNGWDQWRNTDDENIRLKAENDKLRELLLDTLTTISWCTIDCCPSDNKKRELNARACELGIELNDCE